MPELIQAARRVNRGLVLAALVAETGSHGGPPAAARVDAFIINPEGATSEHFAFVGALPLSRFYVAPGKPSQAERESLWQRLAGMFDLPAGTDCPALSSDTTVGLLQAMIEEAAG